MALKFSSSEVTSDATRSDRERFPQLFRQGPMIDRHKARRVVPMRVFVFGFPRTGTACKPASETALMFCPSLPAPYSGSCGSFPYGIRRDLPHGQCFS